MSEVIVEVRLNTNPGGWPTVALHRRHDLLRSWEREGWRESELERVSRLFDEGRTWKMDELTFFTPGQVPRSRGK